MRGRSWKHIVSRPLSLTKAGKLLITIAAWTCFKIKLVTSAWDYRWIQTGVFTECDTVTGSTTVVFFNVPARLQGGLVGNMKAPSGTSSRPGPFYWHLLLAESTLHLYDDSFWLLRDIVRSCEKVTAGSTVTLSKPNLYKYPQ
jgi:hypothetical protein